MLFPDFCRSGIDDILVIGIIVATVPDQSVIHAAVLLTVVYVAENLFGNSRVPYQGIRLGGSQGLCPVLLEEKAPGADGVRVKLVVNHERIDKVEGVLIIHVSPAHDNDRESAAVVIVRNDLFHFFLGICRQER